MPLRRTGYHPQADDTTVEADRLMFDLYRQLTPAQRCARVVSAARAGEALQCALCEADLQPPE